MNFFQESWCRKQSSNKYTNTPCNCIPYPVDPRKVILLFGARSKIGGLVIVCFFFFQHSHQAPIFLLRAMQQDSPHAG